MRKIAALCLMAAISSPVYANCGDVSVVRYSDESGVKYELVLSAKDVENLIVWDIETESPSVSIVDVVRVFRHWAAAEYSVDRYEINSVSLKRFPCWSDDKGWYYVVEHTVRVQDNSVDRYRSVMILGDLSLVEPVKIP